MNEENYLNEYKNCFVDNVTNSNVQTETMTTTIPTPTHTMASPLPSNAAQYLKDQAVRVQKKIQDYEMNFHKRKSIAHHRTSGGDADSVFFETPYLYQSGDYYTKRRLDPNYNFKQMHCNPKQITPALPGPSNLNINDDNMKYFEDCGDRLLYEAESNLVTNCGICGGSEGSVKSLKSSKTVVSRKSSQELRHIVKSKCKLHEMIDETLKQMCNENETINSKPLGNTKEKNTIPMSAMQHCRHCTEKIPTTSNQKDEMTEITKGDFLDCRSADTLTISVDDVVNSKVINPMIRKLQRMYLNNLKEEMSLMEDLEKLPHKVNEVYKATIFKQKE